MKRLAQRATKKKKSGVGKLSSPKPKNLVSPIYLTVPGSKNVTDPCGELHLRNLQFPTTIYHHMKQAQVEKLKLFVEGMKTFPGDEESMIRLLIRAPKLHSCESYGGCTRWAYDAVFFSDGQDRYEPADDVSFDVLGTFCPSCELSRRLIESNPIHYEVPEEDQILTPSSSGYTSESWEWGYDPVVDHCSVDRTVPGKSFWKLSEEKFRTFLTMLCSSLEVREFSQVLGAYRCGHRRVYVTEKTRNRGVENMDFQRDFLDRLKDLEEPRYFGEAMFQICIGEFNPLVGSENSKKENGPFSEDGDDHLFYSPSLTFNVLSSVIHGLSVKMYIGGGEHVFYCSKPSSPALPFRELRGLETFPEDTEFYPTFYVGVPGFSSLIIYSLLFLNEDIPGEFTRVVREDPQQFLRIVGGKIQRNGDNNEFRERLIDYKRNSTINGFEDSIVGLRKCLGGLGIKN